MRVPGRFRRVFFGVREHSGRATLMAIGVQLALLLGRRQVGKAPGFGPGIRWFESSRPSHFFLVWTRWARKDTWSHLTGRMT